MMAALEAGNAVISTFGQMLILTDDDGRFIEIAIVVSQGDSRDPHRSNPQLLIAPSGGVWRGSRYIKEMKR